VKFAGTEIGSVITGENASGARPFDFFIRTVLGSFWKILRWPRFAPRGLDFGRYIIYVNVTML
jgi:hypothetical protein